MSGGDYEVGYGRPPKATRFRKGRSGNPRGRPKGARNKPRPKGGFVVDLPGKRLEQIILDEAYREVTVRQNGYATEMPMARAVVRAMGVTALKGNRPAQAGFTELVSRIEKRDYDTQGEVYQLLIQHQVEGREVLARCEKLGEEPPLLLPHPEDIVIDTRNNRAWVRGPFDETQKKAFDALIENRDEWSEEASMWARKYRNARTPEKKERLLSLWHTAQRLFDRSNDRLPPRYRTRLKDRSRAEGASKPGDFAEIDWG